MNETEAKKAFLQGFSQNLREQKFMCEAWKNMTLDTGIRVRIKGFDRCGVVKKIQGNTGVVEWDKPETKVYMTMPTDVNLGWLFPVLEKDAFNLFLLHSINFVELGVYSI